MLEANAARAAENREQEIHEKITRLAPCDVRAEKPLGDIQEKFDFIHTNFCVEAVVDNFEEFYESYRKLAQYLKPKGYLMALNACGGSWYTIWKDTNKLFQLPIESTHIDTAFEKAGMQNLSLVPTFT